MRLFIEGRVGFCDAVATIEGDRVSKFEACDTRVTEKRREVKEEQILANQDDDYYRGCRRVIQKVRELFANGELFDGRLVEIEPEEAQGLNQGWADKTGEKFRPAHSISCNSGIFEKKYSDMPVDKFEDLVAGHCLDFLFPGEGWEDFKKRENVQILKV